MADPPTAATEHATAARIYDYFLGGEHHGASDRRAAREMEAVNAGLRPAILANRAFLRRAVRFLAERGVDQFLDLGSGVPTAGNVHEIARRANPAARVVYVDTDAVAVAVSEQVLAGDPGAAVLRADMRDTAGVLAHPIVRGLLDLRRPLALLAVSVLHFLPGDEPATLLAAFRAALPPGSHLVISHGSLDGLAGEIRSANEGVLGTYDRDTPTGVRLRSRAEIARYFGEFVVVPPGLVQVGAWRPDEGGGADPRYSIYAGVARKP